MVDDRVHQSSDSKNTADDGTNTREKVHERPPFLRVLDQHGRQFVHHVYPGRVLVPHVVVLHGTFVFRERVLVAPHGLARQLLVHGGHDLHEVLVHQHVGLRGHVHAVQRVPNAGYRHAERDGTDVVRNVQLFLVASVQILETHGNLSVFTDGDELDVHVVVFEALPGGELELSRDLAHFDVAIQLATFVVLFLQCALPVFFLALLETFQILV